MALQWKVLDLLFSFLGKLSIVGMMAAVVLRVPGFTRLEDLWPWVIFHTVTCSMGFWAHIKAVEATPSA